MFGGKKLFITTLSSICFCLQLDSNQIIKLTDEGTETIETNQNPSKVNETIKNLLEERANWAKIATTPEHWIKKTITLYGWLSFDVGASGQIATELYLYESSESMFLRLPSRSISVSTSLALTACADDQISEEAILLIMKGKCVCIEGIFNFPVSSTFCLGSLDSVLKISVPKGQDTRGVPDKFLEQ